MAPSTPGQKPITTKPCTKLPTHQKRSPLITKMKRPSVRRVAGRVSSTRIGRRMVFTRPSTSAASSAAPKLETMIVGMRYATAISETVLISQTASSRIAARRLSGPQFAVGRNARVAAEAAGEARSLEGVVAAVAELQGIQDLKREEHR